MRRSGSKVKKDKMKESKTRIQEIQRFLVGGGSAVIADYVVYQLLLSAGWTLTLAKSVSYVCGAAIGFVINKLWTFESRGYAGTEIVKYAVLYAVSAFVNAAVNKGVVRIVRYEIAGFICATGVSTVMNFFGQKFMVFRKRERTE